MAAELRRVTTRCAPGPALLAILMLLATALLAQTVVKLPKNKYTPHQDVELGREAAAEVRKQYPIIEDEQHAATFAPVFWRVAASIRLTEGR